MDEIITEKDYPVQGIWVVKSILGSLLSLLILGSFFLFGINDEEINFYLIVLIVFIPLHIIYAVLRRATFCYSIEGQFFTLRQGILSKQQRHIPYGVIQNIFVKQDLFDRIFGLASLAVENASQGAGSSATAGEQKVFGMRIGNQQRQQTEMVGFSGNKVSIPGLTKANAEILKGIVLQKMKENPIEDSQSGL